MVYYDVNWNASVDVGLFCTYSTNVSFGQMLPFVVDQNKFSIFVKLVVRIPVFPRTKEPFFETALSLILI